MRVLLLPLDLVGHGGEELWEGERRREAGGRKGERERERDVWNGLLGRAEIVSGGRQSVCLHQSHGEGPRGVKILPSCFSLSMMD